LVDDDSTPDLQGSAGATNHLQGKRFYRRYPAACIIGLVFGTIVFFVIAGNPQYTSTLSRIGNGLGAGILFGGIAFLAVWVLTMGARLALTNLLPSLDTRFTAKSRQTQRHPEQARLHPKTAPPPTRANTNLGHNCIFISYRREDEPNFAGRLYDKLCLEFGDDNVFMDIDSIELGLDFEEVIANYLAQCAAVLVIIGHNWFGSSSGEGLRRLDYPNDYVRREIEVALSRTDTRVIPILVEGVSMPTSTALPETISSLSRRNGLAMTYTRFRSDTDQLITTLRDILRSH
jgi:hypothetical protein